MKKIAAFLVFMFTLVALSASAFAWGPKIDQRPDGFRPGQSRGYFIWRDQNGFHLYTATRGQRHVFTGTITTDGQRFDVKSQNLENDKRPGLHPMFGASSRGGQDRIKLDNDRDTISFRFDNSGRDVDGITFRTMRRQQGKIRFVHGW